jgi:cell division protein FtsN
MDSLIEAPVSTAPVQDLPVHLNAVETDENTERQAATPYEPFLQDWYPAPTEPADAGSLTLTNRQLAIVGFVGILTIGLMAGLGYVAGRVASNGPSRVLMLESAQAAPPQVAPAKETSAFAPPAKPAVTQVKPPAPPPAPVQTQTDAALALKASPVPQLWLTVPSSSGSSFWQVGALDAGMAKISEKYMQDKGLPVRLEPVTGSPLVRVLVGPAEGQELTALKTKLDGLGFQSFLKRY